MAYGEFNGHVIDDVKNFRLATSRHDPTYTTDFIFTPQTVCCDAIRSAILATAWFLMFTDAGAHFMQYTQQATDCQITDRRAYTHFSDYWSMRLAISEKH